MMSPAVCCEPSLTAWRKVEVVRFCGSARRCEAVVILFYMMPFPVTHNTVAEALPAPSARRAFPLPAVTALREGHIAEAIRLVRLERNLSVQEAKSEVDTYLLQYPVLKQKVEQVRTEAREGVLRWLTLLFVGGIGLAYLLA